MDSRNFYLDLKENGPNDSNNQNGPNGQNGQSRYIRMSETNCHGYQTPIFMAIPTAVEFQKYLESVVNFYKGLESNVIKNVPENLKKIQIQKEGKKYSIGLMRRPEGPFLKIKEIKSGKNYSRIYVPAKGMAEFNDHLDELIQENEIKENPGIITSKPKETINHVSENKIASTVLDRSSNQTNTLLSKAFDMGSIFFVLGVREITQGHFLTITEKGQGYKNKVLMTILTALEFQKCLESMIEFYKGLDSTDTINNEKENLHSEIIMKEDKKYLIDLVRNTEGLFLQIKETTDGKSSKMSIPGQGMTYFNEHLNSLMQEYENRLILKADGKSLNHTTSENMIIASEDPSSNFKGQIASKTLDLSSHTIYLDIIENDQGVRLIQMAKLNTKGQKSGIPMTISTASKICEHIASTITFTKVKKNLMKMIVKMNMVAYKNKKGLLTKT